MIHPSMRCPVCGSHAIVKHCASPGCDWFRCMECTTYGTRDQRRIVAGNPSEHD